jgi:hypothetical protein
MNETFIEIGDLVQCIETGLIGVCVSKRKIDSSFGNHGNPFILYNVCFSNGNIISRTPNNLSIILKSKSETGKKSS